MQINIQVFMGTLSKLQLLIVSVVLQVNTTLLFPQSDNYIKGKVFNSITLEPIPFATIMLKNNKLGVFANAEGDFRIICNHNFETDSLIITCIGFKRAGFSLHKLSEKETNIIYLSPATYALGEVKVLASRRKLSAEAIVRKAIRNIPRNYSTKPFNYVSYYRDYQKRDKVYINLNEAIIQTLDIGFNQNSTLDKYRLLDFKLNPDFQRMNISSFYDTIFSPEIEGQNKFIKYAKLPDLGGNELFILMVHDPIRNFQTGSFSFMDTFSRDFIVNHVFSDLTQVYDNNQLLYKISFRARQKLSGDSLRITGTIYIQPKNYSIHKLEYSGYYLVNKNIDKEMFNLDVEYDYKNSVDSLMYLKYISFNNIFNIIDPNDTTYFRITNSQIVLDINSNPSWILDFNNKVDLRSASNKNNFEISIGDKILKINSIKVHGRSILLGLKDNILEYTNIKAKVNFIKDINGKELNKKKSLEFYQYRELFVQEYNKALLFKDSCYMQNLPLLQNGISKYIGDKKYWMNTPENIHTKN
jgi:hypothetical protein